jgi:ATP-binding cassette, subfamily B, bacterial PglK
LRQIYDQYMRIFNRSEKKGLTLIMSGLIVCSLLDAVTVALMAPFTLLLMNPDALFDNQIIRFLYDLIRCESSERFLALFSIAISFLFLARGVLRFVIQCYQATSVGRYRASLSNRLFRSVIMRPYRYHVTHTNAQLQQLLTMQTDGVFAMLDSILLSLSAVSVIICIVIVLLITNWVVTLSIILLLTGILLFSNSYIKKTIQKNADDYNHAYHGMIQWIYQSLGAIKDIIAKRRQAHFINEYTDQARSTAQAYAKYKTWEAAPKFIIETFSMVIIFAAVAILIGTGRNALTYLPLFATFALAATRLIPLFNQLSSTINYITFYRPSINALDQALQEELQTPLLAELVQDDAQSHHSPLSDAIRLQNVCFSFDDSSEPLLEDVSFTIHKGEAVALVGSSGSGKTTLANLLLGLYVPESGEITADGINIHHNPLWWARTVGSIPQFIYLCDDSIRVNIAFGEKPDQIDDEKVWDCLRQAQLKDFVQSLPDGLDTNLGENGIRLSGGQRQRIGIARALYFDPDFLVMDEATSSLDTETEDAIIESVNMLAGKKTLLIIAHRLSTIQDCNSIYRVNHGRIYKER